MIEITWVLSRVPCMFLSESCCYVFICLVASLFKSSQDVLPVSCRFSFHFRASQRCSALKLCIDDPGLVPLHARTIGFPLVSHQSIPQPWHPKFSWSQEKRILNFCRSSRRSIENIRKFHQLILITDSMKDCLAFPHITSKLAWYQSSPTCFTNLDGNNQGPMLSWCFLHQFQGDQPVPSAMPGHFFEWHLGMLLDGETPGQHLHPSKVHSKFDCCGKTL